MTELFGNFKTIENVIPSEHKLFGFACVLQNHEEDDQWEWDYRSGSFEFIHGFYKGSLLAYEHGKIACMAMFVLDDKESPQIISSLVLTMTEANGVFYSSEKDMRIVMRDLILSSWDIDITDIAELVEMSGVDTTNKTLLAVSNSDLNKFYKYKKITHRQMLNHPDLPKIIEKHLIDRFSEKEAITVYGNRLPYSKREQRINEIRYTVVNENTFGYSGVLLTADFEKHVPK